VIDIDIAAKMYQKMAPHLAALPLRWDQEYGYIPADEHHFGLICSRYGHPEEWQKRPPYMVAVTQADPQIDRCFIHRAALIWDDRLARPNGGWPVTFEQFVSAIEAKSEAALGAVLRQIKERMPKDD
jgi:hypothetical protein